MKSSEITMIPFFTADGKLSPEESKIMTYKSIYDVKKILCHFKATDTNHDLFVTAGELKKRIEDFKYNITPNGLAEFIKEGDIDVADNKFSYHGRELFYDVSIINGEIINRALLWLSGTISVGRVHTSYCSL